VEKCHHGFGAHESDVDARGSVPGNARAWLLIEHSDPWEAMLCDTEGIPAFSHTAAVLGVWVTLARTGPACALNWSSVRGRGMAWGLVRRGTDVARSICERAFANRLLAERSGRDSDVVKLMPPINISEADMALGLDALGDSVKEVSQRAHGAAAREAVRPAS
jgi:hypothetical protein